MPEFDRPLPSNVLIVRFSALGDVCMAVPVVYSICRAYPSTRFIFLTKRPTAGVFINHPDNLVVIGADVKEEYSGILGLRRLFHDLKAQYDIDALADLHDVLRTRVFDIMCLMRGMGSSRIDKGRINKYRLTRRDDKRLKPLATSTERYADALRALGFKFDLTFRSVYPPEGGPVELFADITAPKAAGEQWIAVAPFAAHEGKIYPIEMMEEVIAKLSKRPHTKLFLFGGGDFERETFARWCRNYPGIISMAEKRHGFAKEMALLSHCDVMLSMDSGNMHLASLVALPVVSVWGATHPYCGFTGWQQNPDNAVQVDLPCRPCSVFGNKPCLRGDFACMRSITPRMIINKIEKVLRRNKSKSSHSSR